VRGRGERAEQKRDHEQRDCEPEGGAHERLIGIRAFVIKLTPIKR
jgi:hypothetical protein